MLNLKGSLLVPACKAGIPCLGSTPCIVKRTCPCDKAAIQWSTFPFPFPIRAETGFRVRPMSGVTWMLIFPSFLTLRLIFCLAASICRPFMNPGSAQIMAKYPDLLNVWFCVNPLGSRLGLKYLRYFVFLGCKIILVFFFPFSGDKSKFLFPHYRMRCWRLHIALL